MTDSRHYQLFMTLAQGVVYQDTGGNIIAANPAAERMLGLSADQLLGRTSVDSRWHTIREDGSEFPGELHPAMVALQSGQEVRDVIMGVFNPLTADYCWLNVHSVPEFRPGEQTPFQVFTSFEDITKLKHAQDTVAKERENFHKIFTSAPVGLLLLDTDSTVKQVNRRASHLVLRDPGDMINQRVGNALGCLHSTESHKGCGFASACPECPLRQAVESVVQNGSAVHDTEIQVTLLVNGTRTTRWLQISSEPVEIDQKQYAIVMADDITQRKELEEALSRSEALFRAITEESGEGISLADDSGNYVTVNRTFCEMTGYSEDELLKMQFFDLLPEGDVPLLLPETKVGQSAQGELRMQKKDGSHFWADSKAVAVHLLGKNFTLANTRDVTHRKKAEEELRVSREQLFATLNNTPSVAIQWFDETGRVLYWNPASEAIYGWSSAEAVGKRLDQLIYDTGEAEEFLLILQEIKTTGNPCGPYETPFRKRNGQQGWLLSTTFSIPMTEQKLGFVCMDVDITDIRQLQNLQMAQHELAIALSSVQNLTEGLSLCLQSVLKSTGLDAGAFYLIDQANGNLDLIVHSGLPQSFIESVSHFEAVSDRTRLVMAGTPFYTGGRHMALERPETLEHEGLRSLAVIPMRHEGRVVGCMNVASRTLDDIPLLLRQTLETIVAEAGHAVVRLIAEDELRQSEVRFRNLVETTSDWIWEVDENAVYTYASPQIKEILGYEPEEILGKTPFHLMAAEEADRVQAIFAPIAAQRAPIRTLENTNLHKDGRPVVLETSGVPIFDAAGTFRGYRGVDRDITEHKRVEKALYEREMILEDILESTLSGYWDWNIRDNTEFLSPTFKMMLGYEDHELPNSPETWQHLIFPEDLPVVLESFNHHVESRGREPYSNEVRYRHKKGNTVWVLCAGRVIEWAADGSPIRMVGCHLDITERKRVESELRQAQERFQLLAEMSGEYIWQLDLSGHIIYVSPSIEKLHGYTAEEAMRLHYRSFFSEPDLEVANRTFDKAISGKEYQLLQINSLKKDGSQIPVSISVAPIIRDGVVTGVHGVTRDVSAIRLAEEERFEALARFSGFSEASQYGMGMADLDGRIVYVNPTLARILGEESTTACLGKHFPTTYYSGAMTSKLTDQVLPTLMRDGHWHGELLLQSKDGRQIPTHENYFIIRDEKGRPRYLADILTDITERKQAEEQLRLAHERIQTYLDTVEAIIVALEGDGEISLVNRKACRVLGYEEHELLGKNWFATCLTQPEGMRVVHPVFLGMMAGETEQLEYYENSIVTRSGEERLILWHNAVLRDDKGKIVATLSAGEDITERKRIEKALRESEERYRTLVESSPDAVGIFQEGRLVFVNSAAIKLFDGQSAEELFGMTIEEFVHPDDQAEAINRVRRCMAGELDNYTAEVRYLRRDGSTVPVEVIVAPVLFDDRPGLLAIARDISDRKKAQAAIFEKTRQLEHLTQHLEDRVQTEIALRLQSEQTLIQQSRLAAMGEMLGAIAHQWRQPLNALGLTIQNLKDAYFYDELNKAYLEQTVHRSMVQVQRMSQTIDDFRNFFRPDKEQTVFDSMVAVGDVLSLLSAQLEANHIDFRLTCTIHGKTFTRVEDIISCEEKTIRGYRNEFEHVVMNLISNAQEAIIDYRARGGPPAGDRGLIAVQFSRSAGFVGIEISDNGGGIPEAFLERIFEPYFTTKDSDINSAKGTGLGLYMSKTIVEQHMGGKLYAANREYGAAFTIEIPRITTGSTNE